uniref:Adrenomedullin 2 n=1 Tax=Sphenodon punctatus TaxID=8508 RepID=A0A8D0L5B0_SPHPU
MELPLSTDVEWPLTLEQPTVKAATQSPLPAVSEYRLCSHPPCSGSPAPRSLTGPKRGKRHAAVRLHHVQLMRVGCVLGTCQVQNLSHRLWQLMGQSGRQDSSPVNPNSPYSYG